MTTENLMFVQWYHPTGDNKHNAMYGLPVSEKKLGQKQFECQEGTIFRSNKYLYLDIMGGGFIVRSKTTREDSKFYIVIKSANVAIPIDRSTNLYILRIWSVLYYNKLWNDPDELRAIVCDICNAYDKVPNEKKIIGRDAVKQHFEECLREATKQ